MPLDFKSLQGVGIKPELIALTGAADDAAPGPQEGGGEEVGGGGHTEEAEPPYYNDNNPIFISSAETFSVSGNKFYLPTLQAQAETTLWGREAEGLPPSLYRRGGRRGGSPSRVK